MENVLGVINLINQKQLLKELTIHRCLATVPFGGRYRLIDFTLSNFIHAHMKEIAIFINEKYRSLLDHVGTGKEWDLDRQHGGLYVLPPASSDKKIQGDLEQFFDHFVFFERSNADTVVISPGHHVCKLDFNEVLAYHKHEKADITIVYKDYTGEPVQKPLYHKCCLDEEETLRDLDLFTSVKAGDHICLETYVIDKRLFMNMLTNCLENDEHDFLKDVVKANLHKLRVKGYRFEGDMPFIHSIDSYFTSNMSFLNPEQMHSYFYDKWEVYTKIKHEAPTKYGIGSHVTNSFIANGCDIQGHVENSILFRGVKVKKGAIVKNCIIMQKGEIEEGAHIENIITDKQVKITKQRKVMGDSGPKVLKKAQTI